MDEDNNYIQLQKKEDNNNMVSAIKTPLICQRNPYICYTFLKLRCYTKAREEIKMDTNRGVSHFVAIEQIFAMKSISCFLSWCHQFKQDYRLESSSNFLWDFSWRVIQSPTCKTEVYYFKIFSMF